MKILFVTARPPYPPVKGDQLRPYHFIKELSHAHSVELCSFYTNEQELDGLSRLQEFCQTVKAVRLSPCQSCANLAWTFLNLAPFQVNYYRSQTMAAAVRRLAQAKSYDVVHIVLQRMLPYAKEVAHTPVVLDHIDALPLNMRRRAALERSLFKKLIFSLEERLMRRHENRTRSWYEAAVVSSQADKDSLGNPQLRVISNGVDTNLYSPGRTDKDVDLVFTGNMGYFPNVDAAVYFCNAILPLIRRQKRDVSFLIVGSNPNRAVKRLAQDPHVSVTGLVADLKPYLHRAKVFVAPLRAGSGIQNKVLEAMACALPVVSTSCGNAGIGAQSGRQIRLADTPGEFAGAVLSLLNDAQSRETLGTGARVLATTRFNWQERCRQLERVYASVLKTNCA